MPAHLIRFGKHRVRRSYSRIKNVLDLPNLVDVQTSSYKWFLDHGIDEMFKNIMPIDDFKGNLSLGYIGYKLGTPKYTEAEARAHEADYTAPLHITLELTNHQTGEIKTQDVFFGDLPLMTDQGTFIINGAERVVVSQLVRSPGVFFHKDKDKRGRIVYGTTIIPNRGAWMEFLNDAKGLSYVRIDRTRKLPITELVRALGFSSDKEITDILGSNDSLSLTLEKDVHKNPKDSRTEEALKDIYARLRPGEPKTAESARNLLTNRFFDHKRYSTAPVGRYKINEKLNLKSQLLGLTLAETLANPDTGEILAKKGTKVDKKLLHKLTPYLDRKDFKAYTFTPSSDAVDPKKMTIQIVKVYSKKHPGHVVPVISPDNIDLNYTHLTNADIISAMNYFFNMQEHLGSRDDIDHLGNRRIRRVGELLQNQFRIGLARMERVVRERMSIQDAATVTPQKLVNIRPVTAAIKQFFGSSQLSQFMDQNNPLSELTHKRRLSALGPGGLTRDRAGFEVRDVHYTHYGRICPIETPSGPNIGLINSLASYAKINKYGFIETPYRRVSWKTHKVTNKIDYLSADQEDHYVIAEANTPLNDDGSFKAKTAMVRHKSRNYMTDVNNIDYIDVSPKQVVSIGSACIAFLEHDDSNRAMMGSNMQRQSVPLIKPHSPVVSTGVEYRIAKDSGVSKICKHPGTVEYVDAREIRVRRDDGALDKYKLTKFQRSNAGKNYNQTPIVKVGDHVDADEIIADGPAMQDGELALGQNPIIAFMTWHGYNFEDAVAISERMDIDDVYSSIHLQDYKSEARDTKLGPEEITREIPNVGEDALKNLDENGIVRVGAEVHDGDILVGKVTPKGMTELSSEERLLHAIFGEKAREVRDTSLRVPHGAGGIVQDIKVFTRENGDELSPGTNEMVRVYIAQRRKIQVGDKLCGRHGNKSTISIVIPVNDMPYMPNGEPVDVLSSPMGVPSRMNIGQVLELHLGMAARKLGIKVDTPVFDGASNGEIIDSLKEAAMATDGKTVLYNGETGEPFNKRIAVGVMNYLKLDHMVDDKIHARAIGPYSLVTQQPLGGKAQFGGQRFGEMEVWALEAYGAAYTLQEILTYKSDDVIGRVKAYEAIVKGDPLPQPGVPESFRVLVKELQGLGLDMKVLDRNHNQVDLSDEDNENQDVINVDALSKFAEKQEAKENAAHQKASDSTPSSTKTKEPQTADNSKDTSDKK